jgi:hypothetical protein
MRKAIETRKTPSADEIAAMADQGKSISRFFTNAGKMMPPIQNAYVEFKLPILEEGDGQED